MTAGTNALEMGIVLAKNASATHATLERTAIPYAQVTARAVMTLASVKVNGRVNSAKFPNVRMTVQEKEYATALFSLASVTQDGAETIAASLTVQVNQTVITEAHVQ